MRKLFALATLLIALPCSAQIINGPPGSASLPNTAPNQNFAYIRSTCSGQPNCFQSASGDNASVFAAAFAYTNALTTTNYPIAPRQAPQTANNGGSATTSITQNINYSAGDTVYVFICDESGQTFTITDGGSTFTRVQAPGNGGGCFSQVYRSVVGGSAITSSITVATSPSEFYAFSVVAMPFVASDVQAAATTTGVSAAPSVSQTTIAVNSTVISECNWFKTGTAVTFGTPVGGPLYTNIGSGSSTYGMAVLLSPEGSSGSISTAGGTLSTSTTWGCTSVELLAGGASPQTAPTVDIAQGYYYYSSGINPTRPTTIVCEPGTFLNYTGTGHAADIGPVGGYTITNAQFAPAFIASDGCTWTGGNQMTEGLYLQPNVYNVGVRNTTFLNFGNANSYMVYGQCDNWDVEIGPQNRFIINDYLPRNFALSNGGHCDANSFFRVHDNLGICQLGASGNNAGGCTAALAGKGFMLDGDENRVYHNNLAFMLPLVGILCNNPLTNGCIGNQVDQNQMEAVTSPTALPMIQYQAQNGALITQNVMITQTSATSPIGPLGVTDKLIGARINFNSVTQLAAATPVVALNNLTGQVGNFSYSNNCTTALASFIPCPLMHTTGSNITQWNADNWPTLTFAAGTTASYTFQSTYSAAPHCTIPPNIPGTATTLTITTLNTTTLTITASASNGATVFASCSAGDGQ